MNGLYDLTPFLSITTISPFSISLIYFAPIISKAHVSEAIIFAPFSSPITNGRIPRGSLIAINFLFVKSPILYAPSSSNKASIIFFIIVDFLLCAIKCKSASVSVVDWNIAPFFTKFFLNSIPFVRLPLCEQAIPPPIKSANKGWIFFKVVFPVVEYLTCPKAEFPGNLFITDALVKWSPTSPIYGSLLKFFPSKETIPALSWPLCWRACKPRAVRAAASGWPKTPNTPHSSLSLSSYIDSYIFC